MAQALRAATEGEIARGEVGRLIGMSERTGRSVLRGLPEEGVMAPTAERAPPGSDSRTTPPITYSPPTSSEILFATEPF